METRLCRGENLQQLSQVTRSHIFLMRQSETAREGGVVYASIHFMSAAWILFGLTCISLLVGTEYKGVITSGHRMIGFTYEGICKHQE